MDRQVFKLQAPKKTIKGKKWQQENKVAIQYYNRRIKKDGVFSDGLRGF